MPKKTVSDPHLWGQELCRHNLCRCLQQSNLVQAVSSWTCDPFSSPASTSACLLNIATGRVASPETQEYLTGSLVSGHKLHVKFEEECTAEEERLMKPIQRRKVSNFAQGNSKKRRPISKGTPASESVRYIFIRILVILSNSTTFNPRHVI